MEEIQKNSFLETEKIGKLMRKYAIPCIISLVTAALYNICLLYTSTGPTARAHRKTAVTESGFPWHVLSRRQIMGSLTPRICRQTAFALQSVFK